VLERFVRTQVSLDELFAQPLVERAKRYLRESLPPKVYNEPLGNDIDAKGSDFLEKYFHEVGVKINKGDYFRIADMMTKEEIHPDIKKMLDDLQKAIQSINLDEREDKDD
jgi:hypothetical protein